MNDSRTAVHTVREYETFRTGPSLSSQDYDDLEQIHRKLTPGAGEGAAQRVFTRKRNGALAAGNFVGLITTARGRAIEILPKIDLGDEDDRDHETTRRRFLEMLRRHRDLAKAAQLTESSIRDLRRFPMLEVFVLQFLKALNKLVRGGLARRYRSVEENLPHLRGRILFREHIRANMVNRARFYVSHDELSANRPANRLIHSALVKLERQVRSAENRQLLRELTGAFAHVPQAADWHGDWRRHRVDRSMRHYEPVMRWVGLFLFNRGLATFAGRHVNLSLLFPMEKVFEDFVTHCFRRYQDQYEVSAQRPQKSLAEIKGREAFAMKPDISLRRGNQVVFILDAKWKEIDASGGDAHSGNSKRKISQADMYQLFAYGKRYGCRTVALVYPRTRQFTEPLRYRFLSEGGGQEGLKLVCLPFDVSSPEDSVSKAIAEMDTVANASN